MVRTARYILIRVGIGLLIGIGMFYFREAYAQGLTCTGGQVQAFTVISAPCSASGCAAGPANGTTYYSLAELNSANQSRYSQGSVCSTYQFGGPYLWRASGTSYIGQTDALAQAQCANNIGQDQGNVSINASVSCGAPPPPQCTAGQLVGTGSSASMGSFNTTICSSGCLAAPSDTGGTIEVCVINKDTGQPVCVSATGTDGTEWRLTGAACPTGAPQDGFSQAPKCAGDACVTPSTTAEARLTIGGSSYTFVEINNLTVNNYYTTNNGGRITLGTAGAPPKPDNGTLGEPAPSDEDVIVQDGDGNDVDIDYFDPDTVAAGSGGGAGDGDGGGGGGGDGGGGGGDGGDGGDGTGDGEGEGECVGDECEGEEPAIGDGTVPGIPESRTFSESFQAITSATASSPLKQFYEGVNVPGGSCPAPVISMPYLQRDIQMTAHCQVAETIKPQLQAVFFIFYAITAVMLFMRP